MSIMILFTQALVILTETTRASSWFRSRYFVSSSIKIIFELFSDLKHFLMMAQVYALQPKVLLPLEISLPMITLIYLSTLP